MMRLFPAWLALVLVSASPAAAQAFAGPLRVSSVNPRYFTDDRREAIYLTGAHHWDVMRDSGRVDPPEPFDYTGFLDLLSADRHNFLRFWVWDIPQTFCSDDKILFYTVTFPWPRTGPGLATDGKPKFDLSKLDESYFTRLRQRVIQAGERGIYVGIMLFDGFGQQFCRTPTDGHPFDESNNINGISPGSNVHTLNNPGALEVQKTYLRKVADTVNDLDNVLYEIANEAGAASTLWQFELINTLNAYQSTKPRRHPVGMTFQHAGGDNATLFASPADWISPGGTQVGGGPVPYGTDPPPADGRKVIISDTDHIWGSSLGADAGWVWRSFARGLNPIYMNPLNDNPVHASIRRAMGQTIDYARRLNLNLMTPRGNLSSTAHCLANPGSEYLVYQPTGGSFNLNLGTLSGTYRVEWFRPSTGQYSLGTQFTGSGNRSFTPPFSGPAVLYLRSASLPPEPSIQVTILEPADGNVFTDNPSNVPIRAIATDRYGTITKVKLLAGDNLLGVSDVEPHDLVWENAPVGKHTIVARATNSSGEFVYSSPVGISIAPLPDIHLFTLDEGIASFLLMGDLALRYRVEVSENLIHWKLLTETSLYRLPGLSAGAAVIVDPLSPQHQRRYYRASPVPPL